MRSRTVLILAASVAVAVAAVSEDDSAHGDGGYGDLENRYPHTVQPIKTTNFVHSKADEISSIDNYGDGDPQPEQRKRSLIGKGGGEKDGGGCGGGGCGGGHAYPNPDTIPRPLPVGSGAGVGSGFGGFGSFSGFGRFGRRSFNLISGAGGAYSQLKTSDIVVPVKDMVPTGGGVGDGGCPSGSCDQSPLPPPQPIYYQQSDCSGSGYNTQASHARPVVASKDTA